MTLRHGKHAIGGDFQIMIITVSYTHLQLLFVELREEHFERMLMAGVIQRDSGFMAVSVFKRYDSMIRCV